MTFCCVYGLLDYFRVNHRIYHGTLNATYRDDCVFAQEKENDYNHHYDYDGVYCDGGDDRRHVNLSRNFSAADHFETFLFDDPDQKDEKKEQC